MRYGFEVGPCSAYYVGTYRVLAELRSVTRFVHATSAIPGSPFRGWTWEQQALSPHHSHSALHRPRSNNILSSPKNPTHAMFNNLFCQTRKFLPPAPPRMPGVSHQRNLAGGWQRAVEPLEQPPSTNCLGRQRGKWFRLIGTAFANHVRRGGHCLYIPVLVVGVRRLPRLQGTPATRYLLSTRHEEPGILTN